MKITSWLILAVVLLAGCHRDQQSDTTPKNVAAPPPDTGKVLDQALNASSAADTEMMAKVNGQVISRGDVAKEKESLLLSFRGKIAPEQIAQMQPRIQERALDNLINQRLLLQEADRQKITTSARDVEQEIGELKKGYGSDEKFLEQLKTLGITQEQLQHDIELRLKIETLLTKTVPEPPKVEEAAIEAFYKGNTDIFHAKEEVQASHILLTVTATDTPEQKAQKRQKLEGLREQLVKGADFAQLAKENSDCPSKDRGGDLGFFNRGQMVKPFEDAVFQLKVGELSPVVETEFGYHVIKAVNHHEERVLTLAEVHDQVAGYIMQQNREKDVDAYVTKLKETAAIEYAPGLKPNPSPAVVSTTP